MTTPATDDLAATARALYGPLESVHVVGYFAPENFAAYEEIGLKGFTGYFASRSAPMGAVPAEVTVATFYVFAPALVGQAIPGSWDIATPAQVLAARHSGIDAVLRRVCGDMLDSAEIAEAAALAREATTVLSPAGRALYAGHASLPWPDAPHMQLWHAASLLREHRGDGHIAALVQADLDPVEALVSYAAAGGPTRFLKATRGWTEDEWAAGAERLRARGLLGPDLTGTPEGLAVRAEIERQTDAAAIPPWRHLGAGRTARLRELVTPLARRLRDSDLFPRSLRSTF